jgi:hypothetical protein
MLATPQNAVYTQSHLDTISIARKMRTGSVPPKLIQFFGVEPRPEDVTLAEIKQEGLAKMLQSRLPLCYFLVYLLQTYSSENLVS